MKKLTFLFAFLVISQLAFSQEKVHKIVFQLATGDTLMHQGLVRQLNNVKKHWPTSQIEVVVHNAAIDFVVAQKSTVKADIEKLQASGIVFAVCENTMKRKNISKEQVISGAKFVPVGIAEIVEKQEEGYSYLKAGE